MIESSNERANESRKHWFSERSLCGTCWVQIG